MGSTLNCEPGKLNLLSVAFLRVFLSTTGKETKSDRLWRTEGGQQVCTAGGGSRDLRNRLEVTGRGRRQMGSVARGKVDVDQLSSG